MTSSKSIKINTKFPQTDRNRSIIIGVLLSLILITTPFLFYIYKFAPADATEWDTFFGSLESGGFGSVQSYMHALFTKITFVLLTGIWFVTSKNWWKYAILVPFTMFLFQLSGVINQNVQYIDEYDFWYSLPVVLPIIFFLIYISYLVGKRSSGNDSLKKEVDQEITNIFSDKL